MFETANQPNNTEATNNTMEPSIVEQIQKTLLLLVFQQAIVLQLQLILMLL